jgi:hypothetical protein
MISRPSFSLNKASLFAKTRSPRSRLLFEIKKLPENPTITQQLKVKRMEARVGKQIKDFLQTAHSFLPNVEDIDMEPFTHEYIDFPVDDLVGPDDFADKTSEEDGFNDDDDDTDDADAEALSMPVESMILPLPSNIVSPQHKPGMESLILVERELRKGQANDALEGLRIGLANKSLLLLTDVNQSKSTKENTRAWAGVRNCQRQILIHSRAYERAWVALKSVGTPDDLVFYQKLVERDLVVVKDITMAKRFGQGSESVAWIWRIGPAQGSVSEKWMEECE